MSDNNRVLKNSLFLAIRMVVVMIISLFTTKYLLRNLGIEDYGVYNVTLGIVSLCTFLGPAFSNAIQRFFNYELGKNGIVGAKKVFNSSLQIQVALIILFVVICETVGQWYVLERLVVPEGRLEAAYWVFQISVVAVSISMLQVPFVASILAHERMSFYAVVNVLDAILKFVIAIAIAFATYDRLVVYGLLLLCINIINLALYVSYSYRSFNEIRLQLYVNKSLLKGLLSFSGWNLFETFARLGKDQGGNLLLNYFFGPVLNAARGLTIQVSYAFSSIVDSTVMASRPQMVMAYAQGNYNHSLSMFYSLSKGSLLLIYLLSIPVFLDTAYILKLWIGSEIPAYSIELIRLSILFLLVDKLASPVTALIHATGKVKKYHLLSGIINLMVIPITWLGFRLGLEPTSFYVITILGALIAQFVFLYVLKDLFSLCISNYMMKVCLPFVIVLAITFWLPLVVELCMPEGFLRLLSVTVVSILFIPFISFFVALNTSEKSLVVNVIKAKIRSRG